MVVTAEGKRWRAGAISGWLLAAVLGLVVLPATCSRVDRMASTMASTGVSLVNPDDPGRTTTLMGADRGPGVTQEELAVANGLNATTANAAATGDLELFRDRFKSLIEGKRVDVQRIEDGRTVVRLLGISFFDSGSAEVRPEGQAAVRDAMTAMGDIGTRMVWVEGHADDVPVSEGVYPSNWELAAARAANVAKILIAGGMRPTQIAVVSYGATRPTAQGDSAEAKQESRRVSLAILPAAREVAGVP